MSTSLATASPVVPIAKADFTTPAPNEHANFVMGSDINALTAVALDHHASIRSRGINVKHGDAAGNGTDDDTTALQAVIDDAPADSTVFFPPGDYLLDGNAGLTVNKRLHFEGKGARILAPNLAYAGATRGAAILVTGTRTAAAATIDADIARGAMDISVADASGLTVGDLILIRSVNESFNDERTVGANGYGYHKGEHALVVGIAGTTVSLLEPTKDSYDHTQTVYVDVIVPVEKVSLEGIHIDAQTPTGNGQFGLIARYFRDVTLDGCHIEGAGYAGAYFMCGVNAKIADSTVTECRNTSLGYGAYFMGVTGGTAADNTFRHCRHGCDASGQNNEGWAISRSISYVNNDVSACIRAGLSTHGGAEHVQIKGNRIYGCSEGITSRAPNSAIESNKIWANSASGLYAGVSIGEAADADVGRAGEGIRLEGNDIFDAAAHGIFITTPVNGMAISRNVIRRPGQRNGAGSNVGINVRAKTVDGLEIERNTVDMSGSLSSVMAGIAIDPKISEDGSRQRNLFIHHNTLVMGSGSSRTGIVVKGNPASTVGNLSKNVQIHHNSVNGGGTPIDVATGYWARLKVVHNDLSDYEGAVGVHYEASDADPPALAGHTVDHPVIHDNFTQPLSSNAGYFSGAAMHVKGAPTGGAWQQGEYCSHKDPVTGSPNGFQHSGSAFMSQGYDDASRMSYQSFTSNTTATADPTPKADYDKLRADVAAIRTALVNSKHMAGS